MKTLLLITALMLPTFALAGPLDNNADMTWDKVIYLAGPITYIVERKVGTCVLPDTAPWVEIKTIGGADNVTHSDPNIAEGMTMCYRVGAAADAGRTALSGWSNRAEYTSPKLTRPVPANLGVQ